jgi:hypothetical protein
MDSLIPYLTKLRTDHPVVFVLILIPFLTIFINAGIRFFLSPSWEDFQASRPRLSAALKLLKYLGIEPVGVLKMLFKIVTGRDWAPAEPAKETK